MTGMADMSKASVKVGYLGTGLMGAPMARRLVKAGYDVQVWNRSRDKMDALVAAGAHAAATPKEIADTCDVVFMCLTDTRAVDAVVFGDSGISQGNHATTLVDFSTIPPDTTRDIAARLKSANGMAWVDAPVSGGQAGAENGQLSIMCGGDQADFDRAEPAMAVYSKLCRRIGESGAGQMTKMCNQIAIAGLVQGLSEAMHFASKAGLDGASVVEVISQGAAGSWQMSNRFETMLDDHFEHGFAVDWMRKDLGICLATADENGASLPVTALVDQFYKDVQKMGGGRWDTSSLFKRLQAL